LGEKLSIIRPTLILDADRSTVHGSYIIMHVMKSSGLSPRFVSYMHTWYISFVIGMRE